MRSFFGLAALAVFGLTAPIHASTLLSENFNELTAQLGATSVGAFSTINGTNIDIVGPSNGFGALCASPAGGNCIDLDGSGGNPIGQLRSNTQFAAGSYLLSFDLLGDGRGGTSSATVTFGNYMQTFTLGSANNTTGIISNLAVTLTSPGYLLFASNDPAGDQVGLILDNVDVSTPGSVAATPEPSSFLLLGTGLLSVAGTLRRRFA
jgi:hypothetical protein